MVSSKSLRWSIARVAVAPAILGAQEILTLDGDMSPVHDPTMIREGETYYACATNGFAQKDVPRRTNYNE